MKLTHCGITVALALTTCLLAPTAHADGCVPGAQTECVCADQKRSIQVCAASGDRLEPCQCASSPPPEPTAPPIPDPPPPEPDAAPTPPEPTEPPPQDVAMDPRRYSAWAQIPAYASGDEEDEADHEMDRSMVIAGGALTGFGAVALVVGGVLYSLVPRQLVCGNVACAADPDDESQLPPTVLLGVGAASLLTGAILLPIGLAPLFRDKKAPESPASATRLIPSRIAVSLSGGEVQWTF